MKIICFNGPPRSGKDTGGLVLKELLGDRLAIEKFSRPIKRAFAGALGVEITDDIVEFYEAHKEEIIPVLGVSFRQWQIDFSEKFMKPLYGKRVFSQLCIQRINRLPRHVEVVAVTDCGFQIEADTLLSAFNMDQMLLLKVGRPGCNWDSRESVRMEGVENIGISNTDLEAYKREVKSVCKRWLHE